jgi:hypothetical protein
MVHTTTPHPSHYHPAVPPEPADIFTEPDADPDTLANLGPLAAMAGTWEGDEGIDEHPVATGTEVQAYVERYDLQPGDPQTNGPQLLYPLRYHRHIVKPGEVETFHDQVGYWLWEPATGAITLTIALPRAQVAMVVGTAGPGDRSFTLTATRGSTTNGIVSGAFLERAFTTTEVVVHVTVHDDGRWSYDETTTLQVGGSTPFAHRDRNTLRQVAPPTPNPLALAASGAVTSTSLGIGSLRPTTTG